MYFTIHFTSHSQCTLSCSTVMYIEHVFFYKTIVKLPSAILEFLCLYIKRHDVINPFKTVGFSQVANTVNKELKCIY